MARNTRKLSVLSLLVVPIAAVAAQGSLSLDHRLLLLTDADHRSWATSFIEQIMLGMALAADALSRATAAFARCFLMLLHAHCANELAPSHPPKYQSIRL